MTEQQTPDREKKIAEIREALEFNGEWWGNVVEGEPICQDEIDEVKGLIEANRFLLSELDRIEREYAEERAAHNAHMTELCQLEEETRKLREERDKLIKVLRWYADEDTHMIKRRPDGDYAPIVLDHGQRARDILKECGVTVE